MNTFYRLFLALFIALTLGLQGCSSKSKTEDGSQEFSENDLNAMREGRFADGGIPLAEEEGMFRDINFDYDSALLGDTARHYIEYNAQILRSEPNLRIQLEGHCDERGTAEYNLALGAERARAVKELLVSLGISNARLETVSYGEEVPLDSNHDEAAWAKNRRVHFSAFR